MERVLIIGCGGSGKSTLARQLGEKTGLPVVHLDKLFWHPGWVESPPEEIDEKIQQVLEEPAGSWTEISIAPCRSGWNIVIR